MEYILDQPEQPNVKLTHSSYGLRMAAALIDGVIGAALFFIMCFIVGFMFGRDFSLMFSREGQGPDSEYVQYYSYIIMGLFFLNLIIMILYFVIMESSSLQATLGKRAVKIYVGKEDGSKMTFVNSLARYFTRMIWYAILLILLQIGLPQIAAFLIAGIICILAFLMPLWEDKKQAMHDKICKTYVFVK